jgi:hypothetical protein
LESYDALLASITPASGPTKTILNPATGETVGEAPLHDLEYLEKAVAGLLQRNRRGLRWVMKAGQLYS